MPRPTRAVVAGMVYHVLNRANARMAIFHADADYQAFEQVLGEARQKVPVRLLAYCLMPNHWHLLLWPERATDLPAFMHWVGVTHTQRWHAAHGTTGYGHLYQGRYRSFPVQTDHHYLTVQRYVERNPLRASLVKRAQDWRWSSLWRRLSGTDEQRSLLSDTPLPLPNRWVELVNRSQPKEQMEALQKSVLRGRPFGEDAWVTRTAARLDLASTLRPRGRPRKFPISTPGARKGS